MIDIGKELQAAFDEGYLFARQEARAKLKTRTWVIVHGYATPGGDLVWKCSECGKGQHVYGIEADIYGADIAEHQWVACPNCGAVMVGEEGEEYELATEQREHDITFEPTYNIEDGSM